MNLGKQIWCVLSEEMSFETFTSIWSHVSENEKKMATIQNLKFHNSLNDFGRPSPGVGMIFLSESDIYFQRRCRLKFFLPYGRMLTKMKKKL